MNRKTAGSGGYRARCEDGAREYVKGQDEERQQHPAAAQIPPSARHRWRRLRSEWAFPSASVARRTVARPFRRQSEQQRYQARGHQQRQTGDQPVRDESSPGTMIGSGCGLISISSSEPVLEIRPEHPLQRKQGRKQRPDPAHARARRAPGSRGEGSVRVGTSATTMTKNRSGCAASVSVAHREYQNRGERSRRTRSRVRDFDDGIEPRAPPGRAPRGDGW